MAEKSTGIKLKVSAVDATARTFKNIASSAMRVTGAIAKWGAAAAGVAAGAFALTANKLGKLSDVAQSAGATTEELTKLSGALSMLGVEGSAPEELAASFQKMTKTTGEVGVEGFHRVVEQISKLPTVTERSAAAMQIFGRTGLQFMPVIEAAAKNGIGALKDVEAAIPGISQAAAKAGDGFSDAMGAMGRAAKKVWNEGLMKVAELITGEFTGDVRTASLICAAQFEYFAKAAWAYIKPFITDTKAAFLQLGEWIVRVISNSLTIVGGILVTVGENFATRVKGVFQDVMDGAEMLIAKAAGNDDVYNAIVDRAIKREKAIEKATSQNWEETFRVFESQLKWGLGDGPIGNVDLAGLQAARDSAIEAARKAGAAYGKAAITIGPEDRAGFAGEGGRRKRENKDPELILGGTYKAITFAMRQGYASGIEEVKNLLKKVVKGLDGVKEAVEDNGFEMEAVR